MQVARSSDPHVFRRPAKIMLPRALVLAWASRAESPHESGTSIKGRRQIGHAGNGRLRTALYMATMSAAQHNPVIKTFYQRLRAAGKPMKLARCAAARKLLHRAWAVTTKSQPFDPHYQKAGASEAATA